MKAVEVPGKGGPRVISQVRELYLILPSDGLLPKLTTPQKSKETHQEHSRRPIEVVQAQGTGFAMLQRHGCGPNQMWVNTLMEQTALSFAGERVRPGRMAWPWTPHRASLGICLIYSMRMFIFKDCFYDGDDLDKHSIDFYPKDC